MAVATSTLTTFLGSVFGNGLDTALAILLIAWPYIMTVGVIYFFWRLGKKAFISR